MEDRKIRSTLTMRILLSLALLASAHAETSQYMGYNATNDPSHLAFCGANLWGCIGVSTSSRCGRDIELGPMEYTGTDPLTWTYEDGLLKSNRVHSSSWYNHSKEKKCLAPKYVDDGEELVEGQVYPLVLEHCKTSSRRFRFVFEDDRVKSLAPSQVPFCLTIAGSDQMQSAGSRVSLQACDSNNDQQQSIQVYGASASEPFLAAMQNSLGYEDTFDFVFNNPTSTAEERSDSAVVFNVYRENNRENSVYSAEVSSPSGTVSIDAKELIPEDDHRGGNFVAIMMGHNEEVTFTVMDRPHSKYHLCGGASFLGYDNSESAGAWPFAFLALLLLPIAFCCCPCKKGGNGDDDDDKTVASDFDWKEDGKKVDDEASHAPTVNDEEGSSICLDDVEVNVSMVSDKPTSDLDLEIDNKEG